VYGPRCFAILQALPAAGFQEVYVNNTCILAARQPVVAVPAVGAMTPADFATHLVIANNTVFTPDGGAAPAPKGFDNYSAFIAAGFDTGSVLRTDVPDAATIVAWARALVFV